MADRLILLPIIIPFIAAVFLLIAPKGARYIKEAIALIATALTLAVATALFGKNINYTAQWAGYGFDFSLRCYAFSSFIVLAASFFVFLVTLYSTVSLKGKNYAKSFFVYLLITLSFISGAVFSNNLVLM
ncbi:MAG: NADH-quinone oxidoreductase subunit L, partial [Candidatus Omnitrophota bacterium]